MDIDKSSVIKTALVTFSNNKLDFVYCVLYAYKQELNYEIFTFDKKLNKLLENV